MLHTYAVRTHLQQQQHSLFVVGPQLQTTVKRIWVKSILSQNGIDIPTAVQRAFQSDWNDSATIQTIKFSCCLWESLRYK